MARIAETDAPSIGNYRFPMWRRGLLREHPFYQVPSVSAVLVEDTLEMIRDERIAYRSLCSKRESSTHLEDIPQLSCLPRAVPKSALDSLS